MQRGTALGCKCNAARSWQLSPPEALAVCKTILFYTTLCLQEEIRKEEEEGAAASNQLRTLGAFGSLWIIKTKCCILNRAVALLLADEFQNCSGKINRMVKTLRKASPHFEQLNDIS